VQGMDRYNDIAIPIAWPDQTARGDELWMSVLKKFGIVKNLNFRVGHAAIVLIEKSSGGLEYFDFGRYITPRGTGRARSAQSDPRLALHTRAKFGKDGQLLNLLEILQELEGINYATHGAGRLLCSVCEGVSFAKGYEYAEGLVEYGPINYGALAPKNNSCSRYIAQILTRALPAGDKRIRSILYPEFIKASPTSNVVNASSGGRAIFYENGVMEERKMGRLDSLKFQLRQLFDNFTISGAKKLGDDSKAGLLEEPPRPPAIPAHAQWLGGIGEGRWFTLSTSGSEYLISRYDPDGSIEFTVEAVPNQDFNPKEPYSFTFEVHYRRHTIIQNDRTIVFSSQITILHKNAMNY